MSNLPQGTARPPLHRDAGAGKTALTPADREALRSIIREEIAEAVEPPALFDLGAVARRLSVSERTVESLVALGEIPVVRIGTGRGVRRFDPAAVEAFVRRQTRAL